MRIVYVDSSIVVRYYLVDEAGHPGVVEMFDDPDSAIVTSTWTRIECSGAMVRAARIRRVAAGPILARLDLDMSAGPITLVTAAQQDTERAALDIVRRYGVRALDAWHIAVASLVLPGLTGPADEAVFATRDADQARAATAVGLAVA